MKISVVIKENLGEEVGRDTFPTLKDAINNVKKQKKALTPQEKTKIKFKIVQKIR